MRIAAALALFTLVLAACIPGSGEDCPYSEQHEKSLYDWGNHQAAKLNEGEKALRPYQYVVGTDDIMDHFRGYSDGYFGAVMDAKFGRRPTGTTGDHPDVETYVRGYVAGVKDGADITASFSEAESRAFGEGFGDAYIDDKNLCY